METTISSAILKKALKRLQLAGGSSTVPYHGLVLFDSAGLTTQDSELRITARFDLGVEKPFAVRTKQLAAAVSGLSGDVTLLRDEWEERDSLQIKSSGTRFELPVSDAAQFPAHQESLPEVGVQIDLPTFQNLLRFPLAVAEGGGGDPRFLTISLDSADDKLPDAGTDGARLRAAGTNGARLGFCTENIPGPLSLQIPIRAAETVMLLDGPHLDFMPQKNALRFESRDTVIVALQSAVPFPNFKPLLDQPRTRRASVASPLDFLGAVKQVSALADDRRVVVRFPDASVSVEGSARARAVLTATTVAPAELVLDAGDLSTFLNGAVGPVDIDAGDGVNTVLFTAQNRCALLTLLA